jgi:hypothetical protein
MQPHRRILAWGLAGVIGWVALGLEANTEVLWHLGRPDNSNAEFALAPKDYAQFRDDGFYVVGRSEPGRDWPYAHPGPGDAWAGSRRHTFAIVFALDARPADGLGRLLIDLFDTHSASPPRLRVEINGKTYERSLSRGAGDETIYGGSAQGRECLWEIAFPVSLLRTGDNEIRLTTLSGSWLIYDALQLEVPDGAALGAVAPGTHLISLDAPPVWLNQDGWPMQPVKLGVRHVGDEAEAHVQLGAGTPTLVRLRPGVQTLDLRAPASDTPTVLGVTLRAADKTIAATNLTLTPPRIRELWLLPHSHVDIGYTHRQDEIVKVQISNLEKGMALARASASQPPGMRFKWNPEAIWSLDHYLRQASAPQREAFLRAVRAGEVGVDGLYGNMLTGLCRPEELAQCLAFAARLSNLTGVPVESAAICDVPGWTWGLVSMMAQAGVKYFAIGPNYGDRVGTIHLWDNRPFYWRSPSGRERVLCWVVDNYHFYGDLERHVIAQAEKLQRLDFPYDTSFMFWVGVWPGGGVDNAPPDEQTVEKVLAWNAKYAAPRLVIGLARDYFREFERRHGARVPEYGGDLTPYWEDGAGSTARETAMNRASADRLVQAEALFAMRDRGGRPAARFEDAWKNVLLYSEHTWGAWCSISKPDDPFTLDQWRIKQEFALDADRQSRELLAAASAQDSAAAGSVPAVDVFNTTQWQRTDLATLPEAWRASGLVDDRGRPVSSQRLASGALVFLARDVPPFGCRRYRLTSGPPRTHGRARAEGLRLQTARLQLELDGESGAVRSLRLAGVAHDFVDPLAPVGLNDFRYVLGTNAAGAQRNGPVQVRVIENGPLVASLRVTSEAPGCRQLEREVRVIEGLDRVELINRVDRKAVRDKDAVHFGFGFNVPDHTVRMETPWAVVRPNVDQLPGACRNWFTVQRWVDLSNRDYGITWAPLDAPLMQIGAMTANLLGSVAFHEWMTNALESATIYSWAQNNHWHTNYKIDQPGETVFRFVLRPHAGRYVAAEAARFGMETSRPLLVARAGVGSRVTPPLVRVSSPEVLVETVKVSEDGQALVVRLFGVSGRDQEVRLDWSSLTPAALWLTDLSEQPLRLLGRRLQVPAYGVVSVRAEL